ncbi:hypothetical protein Trydic_g9968 [Trypoxylus dichotomus]
MKCIILVALIFLWLEINGKPATVEDEIKNIFNLTDDEYKNIPKKPVAPDASAANARTNADCTCVAYYLCNDSNIMENNACPSYLDVCCKSPKQAA